MADNVCQFELVAFRITLFHNKNAGKTIAGYQQAIGIKAVVGPLNSIEGNDMHKCGSLNYAVPVKLKVP